MNSVPGLDFYLYIPHVSSSTWSLRAVPFSEEYCPSLISWFWSRRGPGPRIPVLLLAWHPTAICKRVQVTYFGPDATHHPHPQTHNERSSHCQFRKASYPSAAGPTKAVPDTTRWPCRITSVSGLSSGSTAKKRPGSPPKTPPAASRTEGDCEIAGGHTTDPGLRWCAQKAWRFSSLRSPTGGGRVPMQTMFLHSSGSNWRAETYQPRTQPFRGW
jgi:hypothetical protein